MQVKIEYRAINYHGQQVTDIVEHEVPEFEEKTVTLNLRSDGRDVPHSFEVTVDQQVMEYLDDIDKRAMMDDREWMAILDYSMYREEAKEEKLVLMKSLIDEFTEVDDLRASLYVAYAKMYDTIKDMKMVDQLSIIASSLGLALESQTYVYQRMLSILNKSNPEDHQNPLGELE